VALQSRSARIARFFASYPAWRYARVCIHARARLFSGDDRQGLADSSVYRSPRVVVFAVGGAGVAQGDRLGCAPSIGQPPDSGEQQDLVFT